MSEAKDPAIKLFGKTIPLPDILAAGSGAAPQLSSLSSSSSSSSSSDHSVDEGPNENRPSSSNSMPEANKSNGVEEEQQPRKEPSEEKLSDTKEENGTRPFTSEEIIDPNATSVGNENLRTSTENEVPAAKTSKTEEQSDTNNSQEKNFKKPDKILPCPRCNSMDTKFCYYNNYNVNQPRHFCKNCQRYWTAGGTMRNVPVGAGRRKNKNSASQYRHITVPEALQNVQPDLPNGIMHHSSLKPNGSVLAFGSETPLCESMVSDLNISEKTMLPRNGFHKPVELRLPVSYGSGENGCSNLSGSSATAANSKDEVVKNGFQEPAVQNCHSFSPQAPCFPGASWLHPWNSAQWTPISAPSAFCPASFPMPFYPPPPYWGCTVPGTWNVPWATRPSSSPNHVCPSGPNSPTLGKHSRDDKLLKSTNSGDVEPPKESNAEKCLWIPKTLRIDDLGEAAKSSIWATLGIKNDEANSVDGAALFKAFRSKGDEKSHISETCPVLQANPAALSRSLKFHESS